MFHTKSIRASLCLLGLLCFTPFARAQLTVDGVVDKTVYPDAVSVRVPPQAGFTYTVLLNANPFPTSVFVPINRPDYYELKVTRTETATGITTNRLIRFIVESSERVGTELGLPPQVPFPVIQSSSNEFVGGNLRVITPQNFPTGYDIPVIAWVENNQGHALRANGLIADSNHPPIQVKRGVGSGFLAATNPAGVLSYSPRIGGLTTNKSITLENSTSWTTVFGTLSGNVAWPINSRIHVTTNLTLTVGSTLTVGAGTIVRVNSSVTITNNGSIVIEGTVDQPVVFMATVRTQPWGGFVQHANNASFTATGAIFTGSGAEPCWFLGHGCSTSLSGIGSHRGEQALISLVGSNCNLTMTDSAAIWLSGQLGHSVGGGNNRYDIRFTRSLMQRVTTGGEYTDASVLPHLFWL